MTADDKSRILALFTDDEADALALLWSNRRIRLLLSRAAVNLWDRGCSVTETLAAISHDLDPDDAVFYFSNGFSAHQAHLIHRSEHGYNNIWDRDSLSATADLVESGLPRDYLTNVLITSDNPQEVDDYRTRYEQAAAGTPKTAEHGPDTLDNLTAELAMLAGFRAIPTCGCKPGE